MKGRTLRETLKDLILRPSKKFNSALISEIHAKCVSADCLDDIHASGIFDTILWPNFHADVTNSHLELILQISSYEYDALSRRKCLDMMEKDESKLTNLILRILKSTLTLRKQDLKLQSSALLFLRVLLAACPSYLVNHDFFPKWILSMFSSYTKSLADVSLDSTGYTTLRHCFLFFCISCVVSPSGECKKMITDSWLPFHFKGEQFDFKTRRLASIISLLLENEKPIKTFIDFQIFLETHGIEKKLPSVEFAPSHYEVSVETYTEELAKLSDEDLSKVATWVDCDVSGESRDFLISIITHSTLQNGLSYSRLYDPFQFTEEDIFDLLEDNQIIPFMPDPTTPKFAPFTDKVISQIRARTAFHYLKRCNERTRGVFERITVVDPGSERGITGSSKYFGALKQISIRGSKAELELANQKFKENVKCGDNILLLELQKPNRHGGANRMVKNGINACAIAKVTSSDDVFQINWKFPGFEDRFNAFIVLPPTTEIIHTDNGLYETLSGLYNSTTVTTSEACDDPKSLESSESAFKNINTGGETTSESTDHKGNGDAQETFSDPQFPKSLSNDSTLLPMFSQKLCLVQNIKSSDKFLLINEFLNGISRAHNNESCLVVFPTRDAVDLFRSNSYFSKVFKLDTNHTYLFQEIEKIHANLEKVAHLAQALGLGKYDFSSSIRKALMLYHLHVQTKWKTFLKYLNKEDLKDYPFANFDSSSLDYSIDGIAEHFSSIRRLFAELQHNLLLDNFDLRDLKDWHVNEIKNFYTNCCDCLLVAEEDLPLIKRTFDNILIQDESALPSLKSGFKKLVVLGDSLINWKPRISSNSSKTQDESTKLINNLKSTNRESHQSAQHILISKLRKHPEVEEAEFCVLLYRYLRLQGRTWESISLAIKSERMRFLIHEILEEEGISRTHQACDKSGNFSYGWPIIQSSSRFSSCDFSIVSCTGAPSLREYQEMEKLTKKKLYLVGPDRDYPFKIKSGELEISPEENPSHDTKGRKTPRVFSNTSEFRSFIGEIETTKNLVS